MDEQNISFFEENEDNKKSKILNQEEKVDTEKYIKMAKERLSNKYKHAIKKYDLDSLKEARAELSELDEEQQGALKYLNYFIDSAYLFLTSKERIKKSKNEKDIYNAKDQVKKKIEDYTYTNNKLKKYKYSLDAQIDEKNESVNFYQQSIDEISKEIASKRKAVSDLEKTVGETDKFDLKRALRSMKRESENSVQLLEDNKYWQTKNCEMALKDYENYICEKYYVEEQIGLIEFNLNFYNNELSELDLLLKKKSVPSLPKVKLESEIIYIENNELKIKMDQKENNQINAYNRAKEKQPSVLDIKNSYLEMRKNRPKISM